MVFSSVTSVTPRLDRPWYTNFLPTFFGPLLSQILTQKKQKMYCTITTTAIYKDTVTIQTNAHTCLAKIWTHAKSLQNFRFLWTGSYLRLNNFLFTMLFTNSERQFHAKAPTTYNTINNNCWFGISPLINLRLIRLGLGFWVLHVHSNLYLYHQRDSVVLVQSSDFLPNLHTVQ